MHFLILYGAAFLRNCFRLIHKTLASLNMFARYDVSICNIILIILLSPRFRENNTSNFLAHQRSDTKQTTTTPKQLLGGTTAHRLPCTQCPNLYLTSDSGPPRRTSTILPRKSIVFRQQHDEGYRKPFLDQNINPKRARFYLVQTLVYCSTCNQCCLPFSS